MDKELYCFGVANLAVRRISLKLQNGLGRQWRYWFVRVGIDKTVRRRHKNRKNLAKQLKAEINKSQAWDFVFWHSVFNVYYSNPSDYSEITNHVFTRACVCLFLAAGRKVGLS